MGIDLVYLVELAVFLLPAYAADGAAAAFVGHLGVSWMAYRLGIPVDPV